MQGGVVPGGLQPHQTQQRIGVGGQRPGDGFDHLSAESEINDATLAHLREQVAGGLLRAGDDRARTKLRLSELARSRVGGHRRDGLGQRT
jgi:hypothetical protein